jgi:hypothetical protein
MKKPAPKKGTKAKKAGKREKPLSLYGMSFDEAIGRLARSKPAPKQSKKFK